MIAPRQNSFFDPAEMKPAVRTVAPVVPATARQSRPDGVREPTTGEKPCVACGGAAAVRGWRLELLPAASSLGLHAGRAGVTPPAEAMETLDSRLWDLYGAGVNPWLAGAKLIGGRMGLETQLALDGVVALEAGFARIMQADDARRFRVASEAERASATPAMILFCGDAGYGGESEDDDLVALSLRPGSRRFWRMTCACDWLGMLRPDQGGTLRLRQDAHLYVSGLIKAAAYRRRGKEEGVTALEKGLLTTRRRSGLASFAEAIQRPGDDPARLAYVRGFAEARRAQAAAVERWRLAGTMPDGALILDPIGLDWTRRGAIADAEWIEIVDAPADGPLGRALQRINPRIGTKHGVRLVGQEPTPKYQRRAA